MMKRLPLGTVVLSPPHPPNRRRETSRQKTTKSGREILKVVQPIAAAAGARAWIEDPPGRADHQRLVVERNGHRRWVSFASSPRDMDVAVQKNISKVKRMLEELTA